MSRPRSLSALPILALALVLPGCGAGDAPPVELASPSNACDEAFAAAAEAGERPGAESPRSPDIDRLTETLEACETADTWLTGVRRHPAALPLELDRETALDQLCARHEDTSVCRDWTSTRSDAVGSDDAGTGTPTG